MKKFLCISSEKKRKKLKIKTKIIKICGITFLFTIFTTVTFGMYTETKIINSKTQIAKPILKFEKGEKIHLSDDNKEGKYQFKIKNYNEEGEITDVEMNYTIEIIIPQNVNVKYSLIREEKVVPIKGNKTEKILMGKDTEEEHVYTLEFKYNNRNESSKENNREKYIELKIYSEQK